MKSKYKILTLLCVIAFILGIFAGLSTEEVSADGVSRATITGNEHIEISHDEALQYLEAGENIYPLTESERNLVERIVAAEARGESLEGMMAVAQTIRDRACTRNQSVTDVCLAPYQYADAYDGEIDIKIKDAVAFTFDRGHSALKYPTTHFYAHCLITEPEWTSAYEYRGTIGAHTFFG